MTSQSELILEQNLISQLAANGYDKVVINDEKELLVNGVSTFAVTKKVSP